MHDYFAAVVVSLRNALIDIFDDVPSKHLVVNQSKKITEICILFIHNEIKVRNCF